MASSAPHRSFWICANAASISRAVVIAKGMSVKRSTAAEACESRSCGGFVGLVGLKITPMRDAAGRYFTEDFKAFGDDVGIEVGQPGDVAAGPREARDDAEADRIRNGSEDNRQGGGGFTRRESGRCTRHQKNGSAEFDEFGRVAGQIVELPACISLVYYRVLAGRITEFAQAALERAQINAIPLRRRR